MRRKRIGIKNMATTSRSNECDNCMTCKFKMVAVCATMSLLVSCISVCEKPINVELLSDSNKVRLEGLLCDEWQVREYYHEDIRRYGRARDIRLTYSADCRASNMLPLYEADKLSGLKRTYRLCNGSSFAPVLRFDLEDPMVPYVESLVYRIDAEGRVLDDVFYLNVSAIVWWWNWTKEHGGSLAGSRMDKPKKSECEVVKLSKRCLFASPFKSEKKGIIVIAEGQACLGCVAKAVQELSDRHGCDVSLTCKHFGFEEWLAADFPR